VALTGSSEIVVEGEAEKFEGKRLRVRRFIDNKLTEVSKDGMQEYLC